MDAITVGIAKQAGLVRSIKETDGTVSLQPSVFSTIVSVTGRGQLFSVTYSPPSGGAKLRITIDGGTPLVVNDDNATPLIYPRSTAAATMYFNVPFDSSFLLEISTTSAVSITGNVVWGDR